MQRMTIFGYFRLFIVATHLSDAPRRRLVVTGDSARIQDETTENSHSYILKIWRLL